MPSRNDAPGLKARRRADGRIVWYWVAAQCSRKAGPYPLKTVRLADQSPDGEAARIAQCQHLHMEPALTQIIEIIGDRSDGCSRYGLIAPPSVAARQNGGGRG